jgi:anti-sigma B factor antagonist
MKANVTMNVRQANPTASVIDIEGEINALAESALMEAYNKATTNGVKNIVLNFQGLDYMNSSGIGLLVTLLIRANRQKQRLSAFGLTDHYAQIFELTRLNEAISIFPNETAALLNS